MLVSRSGDGDAEPIAINLSDAAYRITRGTPGGGGDGRFFLEIGGEEIEFEFRDFPADRTLVSTGPEGRDGLYEIVVNTSSPFSSTNLISRLEAEGLEPFGLYTFGFETNPGNLMGSANYEGTLAGAVYSDGESSDLSGTIGFTANFATNRISGSANATAFTETLDFTINETDIVGNGFATTATVDCPVLDACTSATQIGGTFFGPDGAEISGIAVIDETITTADGTSTVVGAAGYTADRLPSVEP